MANKSPIVEGRKGTFMITARLTRSCRFSTLLKVLRDVFIVRCEFLFAEGIFKYTGYSKHFDEVPEGYETPTYTVDIEGGKILFKRSE